MKIKAKVKLHIEATKATPAPPIGPSLAPHGINISQFCQEFNEKSKSQIGYILPVLITIFEDRSFSFITKTPPASVLLKKAAGIVKGSGEPSRDKVGKVTRKQVEEIAKTKQPDLNTIDLPGAIKTIEGTARSIGIEIIE